MPKRLGIHVIGPRYGEAVVLELPDGGFGVIDSFASRTRTHPVIDFLKSQFPHVRELRFFAVTHPHADHCYRAAELMAAYPVQEVWIFQPFPLCLVQNYYDALHDCGSPDEVEKAMGLPSGSVSLSLLEFEKQVRIRRRAGTIKCRALAGTKTVDLCGGKVKVHFLTPGDEQQYTYKEQIETALKRMSKDGRSLVNLDNLPVPDHNLASGGVLVEFGDSRALLMADAEAKLWDEWLDSNPDLAKWKPVQFVKSAHHGSPNGFHSRLYAEIADPKVTLAVVTPFSKGRTPLPTEPGVRALQGCVKKVYCTNRSAAIESTALNWNPVSRRRLPPIPAAWVKQISGKQSLAKLLAPEAGLKAPIGGREPLIPPSWIAEAQATPALWHLIRHDLRRPIPGLAPSQDYAVTAYLDDTGKAADVSTGYEAGVLV